MWCEEWLPQKPLVSTRPSAPRDRRSRTWWSTASKRITSIPIQRSICPQPSLEPVASSSSWRRSGRVPSPHPARSLPGTVSGDATIVNEQANPSLLPVVVGFVSIPPQGGHDHQDLNQLSTSLVSGGTSVSDSAGTVLSSSSSSSSFAKAQNVCVFPAFGVCTASATAITSQANSASGGGTSSSNPQGTSLLGLSVGGMTVSDNPPPNTTILVPGIGSVTLNEQTCASGSAPPCSGASSSGITVRAIHVIVDNPNAPGVPQGANVIVGEAHADSSHP